MKLDEMMREVTDDTVVDLDLLTRGASSQGRGIRRRRRLAGAFVGVGATAASVVGVCLVATLGQPGSGPPSAPEAGDRVAGTGMVVEPAVPVRLDGRATAALLRAMVDDAADVDFDTYAGQAAPGGAPDTFATLQVTSRAQGVGVVGVNVQDLNDPDNAGLSRTCEPNMGECTVVLLPNKDVLRTTLRRTTSPDGTFVVQGAEFLSESRGLRVVVSATNGFDLGGNAAGVTQYDITRDTTVLNAEQVRSVATDPRWAFEVPAEYADLGAELTPYVDLDADRGDWLSPEEVAARG